MLLARLVRWTLSGSSFFSFGILGPLNVFDVEFEGIFMFDFDMGVDGSIRFVGFRA